LAVYQVLDFPAAVNLDLGGDPLVAVEDLRLGGGAVAGDELAVHDDVGARGGTGAWHTRPPRRRGSPEALGGPARPEDPKAPRPMAEQITRLRQALGVEPW
jgi:hypothetical protein